MNIITPVLPGGYEYIVGQLLVEELQQLGINSSLKYLTSAVYSSAVESGNWDLRSEWLGGTILDPWQGYQQFDSQYYEPIGKNALTLRPDATEGAGLRRHHRQARQREPELQPAPSPPSTRRCRQFYTYQPASPTCRRSTGTSPAPSTGRVGRQTKTCTRYPAIGGDNTCSSSAG